MIYAKPSTALTVVFRAYLASDHVTPATGKTIAITISKNGGAFGNPNAGATNATEISSGFYKVTLDTTDTGTAGPLAVRGAVATVDDVGAIFYVGQAPADVTHWLGTAAATPTVAGVPEVDITHIGGTAVTAAAGIPEVKVASIAANAITAAAMAADAGAEVAAATRTELATELGRIDAAVTTRAVAGDAMALTSGERTTLAAAIWNALTSGMSTVGSIGKKLADWTIHSAADVWAAATRTLTAATNITSTGGTTVPQTGDSFARLGAPAGASLAADVAAVKTQTAAIETDTAEIGAAGAGLTVLATQASVNTIDDFLDTEVAAILAAVDTEVAAIKAVTDLLPNGGALTSLATAAALAAAASDITTLLSRLTATRAGLLDELDPATAGKMAAEVDVLIARLTAIRAGYIDNLSGGAAALEATLTAIKGGSWSTETLVAIAARLPAALTAGGYMKADALAINGATAAAVRLALSSGVIIPGTVDSTAFTPTTTVFDADDITTADADHYIGRVIVFTSGTLVGQATTITDYALTSGRGRFTVDTLTSAPANDVTFVIV